MNIEFIEITSKDSGALVASILPTLITASFAYFMWQWQVAQAKAESIMNGCMMLRHFCIQLKQEISTDPDKPHGVSIESVNNSLAVILTPQSLMGMIDEVLDVHKNWRNRKFVQLNANDVVDETKKLADCIEKCDEIIDELRKIKSYKLLFVKFYRL